jgi:hypothetical protein
MIRGLKKVGVPLLVGIFICCLACSELPELVSLTDCAFNDFAITESSTQIATLSSTVIAVGHVPLRSDAPELKFRFEAPTPLHPDRNPRALAADLLTLYSILRT